MPEGSETEPKDTTGMERKGCHKGAKGLPKRCQMEPTAPQRSPKGAKWAPKGDQNDPKMFLKCYKHDPQRP